LKLNWKNLYQRIFAWGMAGLLLAFAIAGCQTFSDRASKTVVVASKNFTEQIILGEILSQQIENFTNLNVQRKLNLGGTFICHEGIKSGEIDTYVEYTGTSLQAILEKDTNANAQKVYQTVKDTYQNQFGIEVMSPLGFNNTFAIVIRQEDAQQYNLETISDAAEYTSQWTPGFGYEFVEREDGYSGLVETYDLEFQNDPKLMELGLIYQALVEKRVDLVAGNSTDGLIQKFDLTILEDNKNYFPPYEAVPLVRQDTLEKYPQLRQAINLLAGKISAEKMQQMNYAVDVENRTAKAVAAEFLQSSGLVKP